MTGQATAPNHARTGLGDLPLGRCWRGLWGALGLCAVLAGCALPAGMAAGGNGKGASLLTWWGDIRGGLLASGPGQAATAQVVFVRPTAVAARGNFVYVVDRGAQRVYRYDRTTQRLTAFAGLAPGIGWGIYAAPDASLYVSEPAARRIVHYGWDGVLIGAFSDALNLGRPVAFAVDDATGNVWVADGLYHRVVEFNSLGGLLAVIRPCRDQAIGMEGMGAMALSRDSYYLVDPVARRVVVQGKRGGSCRVVGEDRLMAPAAIAVDRFGRIYVGDDYDNLVKVFSPEGQFLAEYGGTGAGPRHFNHIAGLWIDGDMLYVADSLNGRIQTLLISPRTAKEAH